jgi:hypothetical protein
MKRILAVLVSIVVISMSTAAQDKKPSFGVKAGLNLSIFSASINSESSWLPGFHIGCYLKQPLSEKIYFRPELYYSKQGQKDEYIQPPNGPTLGNTSTKLNYLNVPLLFEFGNKVSLQAGPQLGILLSATESGTILNQQIDDDLKGIMKDVDFSFVVGTGIRLGEDLSLGARLNLGLSEIFDDSGDGDFPSIKNRVFHFYLGYRF